MYLKLPMVIQDLNLSIIYRISVLIYSTPYSYKHHMHYANSSLIGFMMGSPASQEVDLAPKKVTKDNQQYIKI